MSDELNSQLSAFVDDELTPEESELFVRRLCRDETLRQTAASYSVIGNAMRGERTLAPNTFAAGVMMAVEGQVVPNVTAPAAKDHSMRHWGYALAASVALAAIALMTLPGSDPGVVEPLTARSDVSTTDSVNDDLIAVPTSLDNGTINQGAARQPLVAASSVAEPIDIAPNPSTQPARAAVIGQPGQGATVVARNEPTSQPSARSATIVTQPPVSTAATITDNGPAQTAASLVAGSRPTRTSAASIRSFTISPSGQDSANVPIVVPVNAENRARLNNLLLQHLNSSGALRQRGGVAFRNVGFETQTESQR